MPLAGLLVGGGLGIGSGIIGAIQAGGAQGAAEDAAKKAVQQYLDIHIPDPEEQKLVLQKYQQTGQLDPRLEVAVKQAQSEMSKVTTDPGLKSAQMGALSELENIGSHGGHSLENDAYLNQVENKVNAENRGRQGAIEQSFAARGMGQPSGLMLSAEEQNNQNQTQNENEASLKTAADAQKSALEAIENSGQMAGQVRNQDFNEASNVAKAQDSVNNFNAQVAAGTQARNVATQNAADKYNLQEKQRISDQNVGIANYQEQHNKALPEQQYRDELAKAGGAAAAYENQAGQYNKSAQTNANMWGNIGQGLLKTGVAAGQTFGKKNSGLDDEEDDGSSDSGSY